MKKANIKQWVEVLRSGAYFQAQGVLVHRDTATGDLSFCCLGVGCKIIGLPIADEKVYRLGFRTATEPTIDGTAPPEFHKWLGLIPDDARPMWSQSDIILDSREALNTLRMPSGGCYHALTCAELNDSGFTFKQIADLIDYFGLDETDY